MLDTRFDQPTGSANHQREHESGLHVRTDLCQDGMTSSLQQPTIISSGEVYILNGSTGGELNPVPFFLNKNLRVLSANLDRAFVAVEPTLWTSPVEGALPPCSVYCFKAEQSEPEYCPEFEVGEARHDVGVCAHCSVFMVHGACEHMMLAMQVHQLQDFNVALKPRAPRKKGTKAQDKKVDDAEPADVAMDETIAASSSRRGPDMTEAEFVDAPADSAAAGAAAPVSPWRRDRKDHCSEFEILGVLWCNA
eukprot:Skav209550  [mRNA]  locus=scaffold2497:351840:363557:+ [translate_table: standard]